MSLFNDRLRQLKDEKGLSAGDLAKALDIKPSTFSYYLKDREPGYDILMKIASFFDVTVDWLIGFSDLRNPKRAVIEPDYNIILESQEHAVIHPENNLPKKEVCSFDNDKKAALEEVKRNYPDIPEDFLASISEIKDDFFPNSDTMVGNAYDESLLLNMISSVFRTYILTIINTNSDENYENEFPIDYLRELLMYMERIQTTLPELMSAYTYHMIQNMAKENATLPTWSQIDDLINMLHNMYQMKYPAETIFKNYQKIMTKIPKNDSRYSQ